MQFCAENDLNYESEIYKYYNGFDRRRLWLIRNNYYYCPICDVELTYTAKPYHENNSNKHNRNIYLKIKDS